MKYVSSKKKHCRWVHFGDWYAYWKKHDWMKDRIENDLEEEIDDELTKKPRKKTRILVATKLRYSQKTARFFENRRLAVFLCCAFGHVLWGRFNTPHEHQ